MAGAFWCKARLGGGVVSRWNCRSGQQPRMNTNLHEIEPMNRPRVMRMEGEHSTLKAVGKVWLLARPHPGPLPRGEVEKVAAFRDNRVAGLVGRTGECFKCMIRENPLHREKLEARAGVGRLLKKGARGSSRHEAQSSLGGLIYLEPPHVGCYFFSESSGSDVSPLIRVHQCASVVKN